MPAGRKARYAPLVALLPHVGARALLAAAAAGDAGGAASTPTAAAAAAAAAADGRAVVAGALRAMESDMVANSAAAFLKALLEGLRREAGACLRRAWRAPPLFPGPLPSLILIHHQSETSPSSRHALTLTRFHRTRAPRHP